MSRARHCVSRTFTVRDIPIECLCEAWGAGVETQNNKKIFVLLSKKDKNKKSNERWDVGVCYSFTGTRFPCYTSLSTIGSAHGIGNLFGTNRTKNWCRN